MTTRRVAASSSMALLVGCLAAGCTGEIDAANGGLGDHPPDDGDPGGGPGDGQPGSPSDPDETGALPVPKSCNGDADPGSVVMHRLNNIEYDNSIRDLLGDTTSPSRLFPANNVGLGFDNEATVLSVSPLHVEKFGQAAATMVDSLFDSNRRSRVVNCSKAAATDACVKPAIVAFAARAWRRPLDGETQTSLLALYDNAISRGATPEQGMRTAFRAILASPRFLYRIEFDADPDSTNVHAIQPHELAARLSYFLWSSTPDDELLDAAAKNELLTSEQVAAQVKRMLSDARVSALTENFAGQWLGVRQTAQANPNAKFKDFSAAVRTDFQNEALAFFRSFLVEDKAPTELLTASYSYLNDNLARYYDVPPPGSATLVRTSLEGTPREGFLTQGNWLLMTSTAARTSPVRRGEWILEQVLCSEVPSPPPDLEADLPDDGATPTTLRAQMEQHRENPTCAACHNLMDPIGLAFENFDAVGRHRATDAGNPIDTAGKLPDGVAFDGPKELVAGVAKGAEFDTCFTSRVLQYSLGRQVEEHDACTLNELTDRVAKSGAGMRGLITEIAQTSAFRFRRAPGGSP